jgi:hypothetical protein
MADLINLSARYVIKTYQFGASNALASTPVNDTLIIEPIDASVSQLWYFTETDIGEYYRMHTEDKGDDVSLDIDNYGGSQTIDIRFKETEDLKGQYWRLDKQSDGSVKLSNNHNGPNVYLDIEESTLKPMLVARNSTSQEWTLSSLGSSSTSTVATSASSTSPGTTTTPSTKSGLDSMPSSSCTSECSASSSPSGSHKLGTGAIAGIVVGPVVVILLAIGVIIWWRMSRGTQTRQPLRGPSTREAYIHA